MSSKEKFVTLGPANGNYQHKSVPAEDQDVPAYLQDEFLAVGGIINGILEGGAFPPYSVMPQRWREGMMIYFSQAVLPDIGSAGIWLYRKAQWWKIVDDPSTIIGSRTVYQLTLTNVQPLTPPPGPEFPPIGWVELPPVKGDKSEFIWSTTLKDYDDDTGVGTWSDPTIWSGGVIDGEDGLPGAPGLPGDDGLRGNFNLLDPVARSAWDDQAAYDLIVAHAIDVGAIVTTPIGGDVVSQQDTPVPGVDDTFVESRFYQVGSGNPGIWEDYELLVDGNLVVHGTMSGESIRANTQIRIGGNASTDLVVLDAQDPDSRIWVGPSGIDGKPVFRVDPLGVLYATEGRFQGETMSNQLDGDIVATSLQSVQEVVVEQTTSDTDSVVIASFTVTPQTDFTGNVVDLTVESMTPPIMNIYVNTTASPLGISASIPSLSLIRATGDGAAESYTVTVTMTTTDYTGEVKVLFAGSGGSGSVEVTSVAWTLTGFSHTSVKFVMKGGAYTAKAFKDSGIFSTLVVPSNIGVITQMAAGNGKQFAWERAVTVYDFKTDAELQLLGLMNIGGDYLDGGGLVITEAEAKGFDLDDQYLQTL